MPKYRKKPVVIEAWQLTIENTKKGLPDFLKNRSDVDVFNIANFATVGATIRTLEGEMTAGEGDYIIQGVNGEVYPCKPDIFAKTYDEVKPVDTQGGDAYREIMYNGWAAKQKLKGDDQ